MGWLKNLMGGRSGPERIDYYEEGFALLGEGKFHESLTSFRLALKDSPGDPIILQQIAITYTRIGMTDEAAKTYRHVLQKDPAAAGAHYGLAYLLLRAGKEREAASHLDAFLVNAPAGSEAEQHISYARTTLAKLRGEMDAAPADDGT